MRIEKHDLNRATWPRGLFKITKECEAVSLSRQGGCTECNIEMMLITPYTAISISLARIPFCRNKLLSFRVWKCLNCNKIDTYLHVVRRHILTGCMSKSGALLHVGAHLLFHTAPAHIRRSRLKKKRRVCVTALS